MEGKQQMTLDKGKKGMMVKVLQIPDEMVRAQIIRFGIIEGAVIKCEEVVPAGPVIISKNQQEIAIGRNLAKYIKVEQIGA
jgi:Fe2+ transport system protein FeoA